MKIIGKTKDGFILQATDYELGRLTGHYSLSEYEKSLGSEQNRRYGGAVQIGDEIQVSAMYSQLTLMATLEKRMADARGILTTVAGGLTMVDPIIREVNAAIDPQE
jgi:hypothetical protein